MYTACTLSQQETCRGARTRLRGPPLLCRRGSALIAAPHELLVERNATTAERAIFGTVRGKVSTHEAEDRLAVELDRGPAPEAADADDLRAHLLHEVDE